MRTLDLNSLKQCLDYDPLTGIFRWKVDGTRMRAGAIAGSKDGRGYWRIKLLGMTYRGHILAWFYVYGVWPSSGIDHKNRIKTDNWINNLRLATQQQNSANVDKTRAKSGLRGVSLVDRKGWRARITVKGHQMHLGYFDTPDQAYEAYRQAANKHFGEFSAAVDCAA